MRERPPDWDVFVKTPTKSSSLSERLTDLSRDTALDGAESKDPEDAYLAHAIRVFSTTEARAMAVRTFFVNLKVCLPTM